MGNPDNLDDIAIKSWHPSWIYSNLSSKKEWCYVDGELYRCLVAECVGLNPINHPFHWAIYEEQETSQLDRMERKLDTVIQLLDARALSSAPFERVPPKPTQLSTDTAASYTLTPES